MLFHNLPYPVVHFHNLHPQYGAEKNIALSCVVVPQMHRIGSNPQTQTHTHTPTHPDTPAWDGFHIGQSLLLHPNIHTPTNVPIHPDSKKVKGWKQRMQTQTTNKSRYAKTTSWNCLVLRGRLWPGSVPPPSYSLSAPKWRSTYLTYLPWPQPQISPRLLKNLPRKSHVGSFRWLKRGSSTRAAPSCTKLDNQVLCRGRLISEQDWTRRLVYAPTAATISSSSSKGGPIQVSCVAATVPTPSGAISVTHPVSTWMHPVSGATL